MSTLRTETLIEPLWNSGVVNLMTQSTINLRYIVRQIIIKLSDKDRLQTFTMIAGYLIGYRVVYSS